MKVLTIKVKVDDSAHAVRILNSFQSGLLSFKMQEFYTFTRGDSA